MQKQPLLTVRQAAAALGVGEKAIQEQLVSGQLKGEKKSEWLQDKWYVYKGEIDERVAKNKAEEAKKPKRSTMVPSKGARKELINFGIEPIGTAKRGSAARMTKDLSVPEDRDDESKIWLLSEREKVKMIVEQVMQPLVEKIAAQAAELAEKDLIIGEQAERLRLLPDFEKRSADERKARETEVKSLQEQIAKLSEAAKQGQLIKEKVSELEVALNRLHELKQEDEIAAKQELDRLKQEKEAEIASIKSELVQMTTQLELAERPWWKKVLRQIELIKKR